MQRHELGCLGKEYAIPVAQSLLLVLFLILEADHMKLFGKGQNDVSGRRVQEQRLRIRNGPFLAIDTIIELEPLVLIWGSLSI